MLIGEKISRMQWHFFMKCSDHRQMREIMVIKRETHSTLTTNYKQSGQTTIYLTPKTVTKSVYALILAVQGPLNNKSKSTTQAKGKCSVKEITLNTEMRLFEFGVLQRAHHSFQVSGFTFITAYHMFIYL